ncbi:MAG: glycoside hydrolase family 5 protein [Oscillospiraceae bacterium]
MNFIKKHLSIALAALLSVSMLAGCGKTDTAGTDNTADTASKQEEAAPKGKSGIVTIADNSVDFVKNMKLGWNLGNTLDATGSGMSSETSWGQPKTTKEMIDFVKDSGFTTIRIPVTWSNHVDDQYNIDEEWMNRVNEVVDYAIDDGLYVILNSHHDNDKYYPTSEKYAESSKYLTTIWKQIAERFADYDEQLIFEGMNEPRLSGTNKEWWFSDTDADGIDSIETVSKLDQDFVDTVRAAGGYNETRYLMVPSNRADAWTAMHKSFTLPTDPANRLIVSVHAYSPYDFAMNEKGYKDWDGSKVGDLGFMDNLKTTFIDKGVGVVIGEFGATNKDNLDARVSWANDFTAKASANGISCVWWDNAGIKVGSENFGLVDRLGKKIYYPEILDAMLKNYNN